MGKSAKDQPADKPQDIVITGVPRSGTTLCCYLLSQLPNVIALNESIRVGRFRTEELALQGTASFYARTRHTLLEKGWAFAKATKEGLTDNNFAMTGNRERVVAKQRVQIDKPLDANFTLAVKHNAFFTILLAQLREIYPTYAIIRNPFSVLGSWNSVDIPATRGEVRAAEWLAPQLAADLEKIPDQFDKQIHILDWYFGKYLQLPKENVLKYEEMIQTNGHSLKAIVPSAVQLERSLENKNKSKLYDMELMKKLADKLLNMDHACWAFYDKTEVEKLF